MKNQKVLAELVDGCHLHCTLCWNRNRKPSFENMPLEIVDLVVEKYGDYSSIDWYNWGEPLLHKDFVSVSELIKGTKSRVSSSLSLTLSDEKIGALDNFFKVVVSLSGMTPDTYNLYHRGGSLGVVLKNLKRVADRINTRLMVQWLDHPDNYREFTECKDLCDSIGAVLFVKGLNCEVEDQAAGFTHEYLKKYRVKRRRCYLMNDIVIGVNGDYLLCCASHNVKIGLNIKDNVSGEEIVAAKRGTDLCSECQKRELWRLY